MSVVARLPSTFLTTSNFPYDLGWENADKYDEFFVLVGSRRPIVRQQIMLRTESSCLAWQDLSHIGQTYSTVE